MKEEVGKLTGAEIVLTDFIARMDAAYTVADVIISRAGALSISELCLVGKPVILVPSPNVSEDHQTKNAMALVKNHAAILVKDNEAQLTLLDRAENLLADHREQKQLSEAILRMAKPDATKEIVDTIIETAR
jgi:UDP-N-acetylglucosamine--N-acetylmuramyl-(pentapeptide) pyrophosphoryl-undecaprenol N-acetylglucosamine transferase